ncbi:ABC transporter ATP-binding protein [Adlercreutzia murintestinalis]|uniref:ABC transporter ATP-binding protein n=1 Tax=Adlercreutzia murintestinalis TaxID=2941325 RepID=UPI00203CCD84|nr:ABC transporter ATP-binding protein [Adlercreutzia murintestinalis]
MEYAIECRGLEKSYPGFALGPLDLNVERGSIVGLVGPNGVGKTTLIKLLLGLITPDAGSLALLGQPLPDPANMPAALKARIGVVFDTCAFTQASRVRDVAQLGRASYQEWDAPLFTRFLVDFGLDPKKQIAKLSRGMGMKLSLAFALAHHPELLVLDEATAGLDPLARDEMLDLLRSFMLDEHHAILMATHITSDLEKIADKVVCIDAGAMLFCEQKEAICDEAGIAHLRSSQLADLLVQHDAATAPLFVLKHEYGVDVLVPDRFAFGKAHPDIPVDRVAIDDYLNLVLKGEKHAGHDQI